MVRRLEAGGLAWRSRWRSGSAARSSPTSAQQWLDGARKRLDAALGDSEDGTPWADPVTRTATSRWNVAWTRAWTRRGRRTGGRRGRTRSPGSARPTRSSRSAAADLELAAEAADLAGRSDDAVRLLRRAHLANADAGAVGPALRCAYWLGKTLSWGGEFAQAGAWLARARRLAEAHPDCPERAYLQLYETEQLFRAGASAETAARPPGPLVDGGRPGRRRRPRGGRADDVRRRADLGRPGGRRARPARRGDGRGRRRRPVRRGRPGSLYCVAIGICQELHELRRAREWTRRAVRAGARPSPSSPAPTGACAGCTGSSCCGCSGALAGRARRGQARLRRS